MTANDKEKKGQENNQLPAADCPLPTADCQLRGRQTWAEIDLQALVENYRALTSLLIPPAGNSKVIPVIKADAYGHGMVPVARALAAAGASMFAVGIVKEGICLREAGISQDILVLGTAWSGQETEAIQNRLTLAVDAPEYVRCLESAGKNEAASVSVHIKVDTGMARLGVRWDAMEPLLSAVKRTDRVCVKGIFSHLSSADECDPAFTLEQIRRFESSLSAIQESGLRPGEIHFANSAGFLRYEHLRRWSARAGIAIYGYPPDSQHPPVKLRPVLGLKTRIGPIRSLRAGEPIGYNRKYHASRDARVATLPVGYADGFSRRLGNRGRVIIQDKWAPVIGAVSMDMIAVDLTDLPEVGEGNEVILLGSSAHCRMMADEWASLLDTIPYEVLCGIASRVPRIYSKSSHEFRELGP
jgi:alanine racemase